MSQEAEGSAAMLGSTDIVVIAVAVAAVAYFLFFRKKPEVETESFKRLSVVTPGRVGFDSNFVRRMNKGGKKMVVFFGSQTGTAEEFATRLAKDARRYGLKAITGDPEECDMEELENMGQVENGFAVFCMATYGEGDPTDNSQEFHDWLQQDGHNLSDLKYAVFGLGNKTYENYNTMGKYVDKKLSELGAERIFDLGLGDDDGNIEEDFVTWKEKFWTSICERFGLEPLGEDTVLREYNLEIHDDMASDQIFTGEPQRLHSFQKQKRPFDAKNPFLAPIRVNRELHEGGDRSCMHIELDITDSGIKYEAGDHVAIYPKNDSETVERIGQRLNVDLDTVFSLKNIDEEASKQHPFPCPCTYRTALTYYVDIAGVPRTHVIQALTEFTEDPKEKEFLKLLAKPTPEGKKEYSEWILKGQRNILAVLEDLPSLKPPLDLILELAPRLQVRYYSISSSSKVHPTAIHVTAVLVNFTTKTGREYKGVATTWLKNLIPNDENPPRVPIYVRRSQFKLPRKHQLPILMIGPGTGLAPFRGFIQERNFQKKQDKPVGKSVLYFGCRNKKIDYLYQNELTEFENDGTLSALHVAFSRDQNKKVYVTHLLRENTEELWNVINDGGHIYVCGDARNMARDVHQLLLDVIKTKGNKTASEAEAFVKKMSSQGKYSCDVWS
ncbi:NADPH--cytochrome P450 reductase [Trichoplax sp. H2]|nr:NADPH--cytochrome P450 reductase [Trichoplax sp. H2]|eukprot:RDD42884.1 NADPH--cytochrome P450 reductase [Trichoplax sp. H2]